MLRYVNKSVKMLQQSNPKKHTRVIHNCSNLLINDRFLLVSAHICSYKRGCFNSPLITMLAQYIKSPCNNPQKAWRKAGQRVQSLTQYNVQKQEGGREATAILLGVLPSLFRHQRGAFMCTVWGCQDCNLQPIGEILKGAHYQTH